MKLTINHMSYDDRLDKSLLEVGNRLRKGEELTVNELKKTAFIGQYTGKPQGIPFEWVDVLVSAGLIECYSGNYDTGDRHYTLIPTL